MRALNWVVSKSFRITQTSAASLVVERPGLRPVFSLTATWSEVRTDHFRL